jgi:hypothetical protein
MEGCAKRRTFYIVHTTGSAEGHRNLALAIRAFKFPFHSDKESGKLDGDESGA